MSKLNIKNPEKQPKLPKTQNMPVRSHCPESQKAGFYRPETRLAAQYAVLGTLAGQFVISIRGALRFASSTLQESQKIKNWPAVPILA